MGYIYSLEQRSNHKKSEYYVDVGTKDARKFSYIFSDAIDSKKLYDSISIQTFYDKGAIDMQSLLAVTFAVKYR